MSTFNMRYLSALFLIFFCAIHLACAQVTFSKGWGPGKRAVQSVLQDSECRINAKSLALIFHSLMAELKRSMACDHHQAVLNYLQALAIGEH